MRPKNLHSNIFLDSGDPAETKQIKKLLGFLDGQTTNPSLISKNPMAQERLQSGQLFTANEALGFYKQIIAEIADELSDKPISIEVYADQTTTAQEMLTQADEFCTWMDKPYIKLPITQSGLQAARQAVVDGIRVNMTLCFSQEQAAAVYAATKGAKKDQVFISPFVGRLDDIGYDGVEVVANILEMFADSDHHVQVLAASIRSVEHLVRVIELEVDAVTVSAAVLHQWNAMQMPLVLQRQVAKSSVLHPIEFSQIDLNRPWQEYAIEHQLTQAGLAKFVEDWNRLIGS